MFANNQIENLDELKQVAISMYNQPSVSERDLKVNLIFQFVELLGFNTEDPSEFMNCQVFDLQGIDSFDYELIKEDERTKNKTVLKIVPKDSPLDQFEHLIKDAFSLYKQIGFAIITDGFKYAIFESSNNPKTDYSKIQIEPIFIINLCELDENDLSSLRILTKDKRKLMFNKNSKSDDILYEGNNEDEDNFNKKKKKIKRSKPGSFNGKLVSKIIGGGIAIVLIAGICVILFEGNDEIIIDNPPVIENTTQEPSTDNSLSVQSSSNTVSTFNPNIQFINLKNILELNVYQPGDKLEINLISDILKDAIIKFEIYCGDEKAIVYSTVNEKGQAHSNFNIPESWSNPEIQVIAYMRFDENDYIQPKEIREKYGEKGEYIVQQSDTQIYSLVSNKTTHNNESVQKYLEEYEYNKKAQLTKDMPNDFSKVEYMIDPYGNLKIVPEGYSLTYSNISENRYIYPQIYYDTTRQKAYFYIVAGHTGRDLINMRAITFEANGHKWGYEIGTNQKETSVNGGLAAEWVYFNDTDTPKLLNDMTLLANANISQVNAVGHKRKTHDLTDEEKSNIKQFLYLYQKYFVDSFVFTPEMLSGELLKDVNLNYIKKPISIKVRTQVEVNQIEKQKSLIKNKEQNGEDVTEDTKRLTEMETMFKYLSSENITSLYNEISNSVGQEDFSDDKNSKNYIILFPEYENKDGQIEQGYPTEIIIYKDQTIHVQIKGDALKGDDLTAIYVKTKISEQLFNKLTNDIESASYEK